MTPIVLSETRRHFKYIKLKEFLSSEQDYSNSYKQSAMKFYGEVQCATAELIK